MMLSNEFPINYFSVSEVEQDWPEEFQVCYLPGGGFRTKAESELACMQMPCQPFNTSDSKAQHTMKMGLPHMDAPA